LKDHFNKAGTPADVDRLSDLCEAYGTHEWLWCLSPAHGPCIEDETEFVEAVRVRLGAGGPIDGGICGACGVARLDASGAHASTCSLCEATRGHNAVRNLLFDVSSAIDPSTEREPEGLVPSCPTLRPADVLSPAARPGCMAALDIGVTSPMAASAGEDAAESMYKRKLAEREQIQEELQQQGISYIPVVWTAFGRAHEEAAAVVRCLARRWARRRGHASANALVRRIVASIGVCLARRAARMSLACMPRPACEDTSLGDGGGMQSEDPWAEEPGAPAAAPVHQ
jgi:hypothetical protein